MTINTYNTINNMINEELDGEYTATNGYRPLPIRHLPLSGLKRTGSIAKHQIKMMRSAADASTAIHTLETRYCHWM